MVLVLILKVILAKFPTAKDFLKGNDDLIRDTIVIALRPAINVLTPVFLGVSYARPFMIENTQAAKFVGALLWMAWILIIQRSPPAMVEIRKEHLERAGSLGISWSFWIPLGMLFLFGYIVPILPFLLQYPEFRMVAAVLLVDLFLQCYLAILLYQKYRAAGSTQPTRGKPAT